MAKTLAYSGVRKRGLKNFGNTCFINSAIQCLSNCEELTFYIINKQWVKNINPILSKSEGRIICEYNILL